MMTLRQHPNAIWGRWRLWVLATTLGWMFGLLAGWILFSLGVGVLGFRQIGLMTMPFLPLVVAGTGVGMAQWPVLRSQLAQAHLWVLANLAGWSLGSILAVAVGRSTATIVDGAMRSSADDSFGISVGLWVGGAALGLVVGVMQRLVVCRRASGSVELIAASAVAMAVNLLVYDLFLRFAEFVGLLAFVAMGGVILGVITAEPMRRMLDL